MRLRFRQEVGGFSMDTVAESSSQQLIPRRLIEHYHSFPQIVVAATLSIIQWSRGYIDVKYISSDQRCHNKISYVLFSCIISKTSAIRRLAIIFFKTK